MSTIYFYIPDYHCVSRSGMAMCIVIKQCCAKLARAGQGYYWQILSVASSLILLYSFPRVGGGLHFTLLLLHWLDIMRWNLFYSSMINFSFQIDPVYLPYPKGEKISCQRRIYLRSEIKLLVQNWCHPHCVFREGAANRRSQIKPPGYNFLAGLSCLVMAIRVVEISNRGYKIFAWESTYSKEIIKFWELG